ncbi:hypothetical protein JCM10207_005235 [Rhodosporidiobolus poonsookiae]
MAAEGLPLPPPAPLPASPSLKRPRPPSPPPHSPSSPKRIAPSAAANTADGHRPPLTRTNTGGSAQGASAGAGACRLLWRGRLVTSDGDSLYGVAIIAHLFTLSSTASPHLAKGLSPSVSPFDDPFASASSSALSGADMCLGLEMLRGADVKIKGEVGVKRKGTDSPVSTVGAKGRKGKARAKDVDEVEVETPTDVRVYIDERCPETVEWFEDMFCREGREGMGVKIDAGGEEVIVFASPPSFPAEGVENVDPAASTSAAPARPALTLLLGRPSRSAVRKPRPDDPMPRENLFTKKLRKTASLPASAFSLAPPPPKPKRQTAKDKAIASLLGASSSNGGSSASASRPKPKHSSSLPPAMAFPPPPPPSTTSASARGLARSSSSSRLFAPSSASAHAARESSLPPLSAASLQRRQSLIVPSASANGGRTFNRTHSRSSMLLDSPPSSDAEDNDDGAFLHPLRFGASRRASGSASASRGGSRAPSPTPSVASTSFALDGEGEGDEDRDESQDALAELRSFGTGSGVGAAAGRARAGGMKRSSSLPVGQFALADEAERERERKRRREDRAGTALPSAAGVSGAVPRAGSVGPAGAGAGEGTVEARNKNTVKKLALNRLMTLGVGKEHVEFKDVFSFTTRGVAFAMRSTFKTALLTPSDRLHAEQLIEAHLRMYLPSPFFAFPSGSLLPTPTPEPVSVPPPPTSAAVPQVKTEPLDTLPLPPSLPSPKSLGDGLDDPAAAQRAAGDLAPLDGDDEMAETQLPNEGESQPVESGAMEMMA